MGTNADALISQVSNIIAALGALGIAAFALVDATKIGRKGGISNSGFSFIEGALRKFFAASSAPGYSQLRDTLHGIWIDGMALADQKATAKSLIKLRLSPANASAWATTTNVNATVLTAVAQKMTSGQDLDPAEMNALGRFDLGLSEILDDGYQHADQRYRNRAKVLAAVVATCLAFFGGWAIATDTTTYLMSRQMCQALLCGLLATPIAPISKDLTSALAAGVKVAQALRR